MNEQLRLLISLQEIDSAILSITEEIECLPNKLVKAKASLKEASTLFEEIKAEYEKFDKNKKQKYDELEEIQEKINKLKAKSTEIKTNKEYEAHLKEIKTFEKKKYQVEDKILLIMETLDTLEKNLKKEEAKFKKAEDNSRREAKILEEEKNKLYSGMEVYKIKRKDIVRNVDEEIYEKYMALIKSGDGIAVVPTQNEICLGCNTNIPRQLYNDIKNNMDIFTCYHCNRFLFYSASVASGDAPRRADSPEAKKRNDHTS